MLKILIFGYGGDEFQVVILHRIFYNITSSKEGDTTLSSKEVANSCHLDTSVSGAVSREAIAPDLLNCVTSAILVIFQHICLRK